MTSKRHGRGGKGKKSCYEITVIGHAEARVRLSVSCFGGCACAAVRRQINMEDQRSGGGYRRAVYRQAKTEVT